MLRRYGVSVYRSSISAYSPSSIIHIKMASSMNARQLSTSTQRRPNSTLSASDSLDHGASASVAAVSVEDADLEHAKDPSGPPKMTPPLATLPTTYLLRSILICTITTNPFLSNTMTNFLMKHSHALSNNILTASILKRTFYNHFCGGENKAEIDTTLKQLKEWGFGGIILSYAKEVEIPTSKSQTTSTTEPSESAAESPETGVNTDKDITSWKLGTLQTISYSEPGSFVAIKYSGAGISSLQRMQQNLPWSRSLQSALEEICAAAQTRGIKLLYDAEQAKVQDAMDSYTLALMKKYNRVDAAPVVYNTYQMYLKSSPEKIRRHLEMAKREGFSFGAKVVRGAYLHSDPRELICDTKEDTDRAYDGVIEELMTGEFGVEVGVVVATHNMDSVEKARDLLKRMQNDVGTAGTTYGKSIVMAQLAGMADEVSMSVISKNPPLLPSPSSTFSTLHPKQRQVSTTENNSTPEQGYVTVIKYIPWGTLEECIKYLLRRADENKDSLKRTDETRRAAWRELWRRALRRETL